MVAAQCVRSEITVTPCPSGFAPQGREIFPHDSGLIEVFSFFVWSILAVLAVAIAARQVLEMIRRY